MLIIKEKAYSGEDIQEDVKTFNQRPQPSPLLSSGNMMVDGIV